MKATPRLWRVITDRDFNCATVFDRAGQTIPLEVYLSGTSANGSYFTGQLYLRNNQLRRLEFRDAGQRGLADIFRHQELEMTQLQELLIFGPLCRPTPSQPAFYLPIAPLEQLLLRLVGPRSWTVFRRLKTLTSLELLGTMIPSVAIFYHITEGCPALRHLSLRHVTLSTTDALPGVGFPAGEFLHFPELRSLVVEDGKNGIQSSISLINAEKLESADISAYRLPSEHFATALSPERYSSPLRSAIRNSLRKSDSIMIDVTYNTIDIRAQGHSSMGPALQLSTCSSAANTLLRPFHLFDKFAAPPVKLSIKLSLIQGIDPQVPPGGGIAFIRALPSLSTFHTDFIPPMDLLDALAAHDQTHDTIATCSKLCPRLNTVVTPQFSSQGREELFHAMVRVILGRQRGLAGVGGQFRWLSEAAEFNARSRTWVSR